MAAAHVSMQLPSAHLFRLPPNSEPNTIPSPQAGSFAHAPPISIPDRLYWAALDVRVPLTIAAVYAVTAKLLNRYNRSTGRRPWAISRSRLFFAFVVLHNVFLAVYSAWTWLGMLGTLRRSVANPFTNTGDSSTGGWAATVDSVCRLSGSPGLGNGLYFDETAGHWLTHSAPSSPAFATLPDRSQPGRIWNEGLAFYGWIFYLSKFYEVLDTFIILAKGKYSSTLQTYHHAGAMMCMWAGMRYMSSPIWMFVFVNSGIHAMMYSYYTFTAFSIRVPTGVKRSLTSMQITQFLVGASYAMAHSFVYYMVPVSTRSPRSAAAAQAANSTAVSAGHTTDLSFKTVPCIATTGETFAIWLNVLYLAPLTYLFVKFFITSYLRRSSAENARATRLGKEANGGGDADGHNRSSASATGHANLVATIATTEAQVRRRLSNVGNLAEKAGWDAARGLEKEVYGDSGEAVDRSEPAPNAAADTTSGRSKKSKGRTDKDAK